MNPFELLLYVVLALIFTGGMLYTIVMDLTPRVVAIILKIAGIVLTFVAIDDFFNKDKRKQKARERLKIAIAQIYSRETIEGDYLYLINLIRVHLLGLEKKLILRVKYHLTVDGQMYAQVKRIPLEDKYDNLIAPVLDSDYIEVVYEIKKIGSNRDMYSEIVGRVKE